MEFDTRGPTHDRAARFGLRAGSARTPFMSNAQQLLQEISDYCRQTGLAESTFGRRAVNDGKLTNRLRNGGRITTDTLDRIRSFMAENRDLPAWPNFIPRASETRPTPPTVSANTAPLRAGEPDPQRNFRF